VLSGFLMTLILNETYGFGPGHFVRFWTNRFLRLYPAYLIGTLIVRYSDFLRPGMGLLMATLAATIGFSLLVHLGVERRIETLRAAIKRRRWVSSFAWRSRSAAAPALPAE